MAYVFELEYGATSVSLANSSGVSHINYFPSCGDDFSETGIISETFEVRIHGTNNAGMQAAIEGLNKCFMMARLRQERLAGDVVYVNLQPTNYAAEWRSEILDGRVDILPHDKPMIDSAYTIPAQVTWVRRNWWEGPQADVPLTNGNDTDDTDGLKVYFCNDGTGAAGSIHHNYATIDGVNDIDGDLPGFGILTAEMAQDTDYLYMSIGPTADMPIHWFEHPSSATVDATASNGSYYTVASGGVYADASRTYSLTNNDNNNPSGAPLRLLARIGNSDATKTSVKIVPGVSVRSGTTENMAPVYANLATFDVENLGVSPIGLSKLDASVPAVRQISVALLVYIPAGNLYVDFVQLAPAQTVRDYYMPGAAAQTLSDDTVTDTARYSYPVTGTTIYGTPRITGSNKILIYPGVDQKLTLVGSTWARDYYATITLKYRPRRSTL